MTDHERRVLFCDYWLPDRSKCRRVATERTTDRWGAPLVFCKKHLALAGWQYQMAPSEVS